MRWLSALLFGLTLVALGNAMAGEDSTHKWHCTGANYYDTASLQNFNPAMSDCDARTR